MTYATDYGFAITCREDAPRARIEWELDLHHLPVRPLSDESREAFLTGNRFGTRLPDAGRVLFRLLTGADERKLSALKRNAGDRMLSAMLSFRVAQVDGIGFNAQESMKFLSPVLDLAGGSLGELMSAQAAGLASQALKAFGVSADDAAIAVDRMLQPVNVSHSTPPSCRWRSATRRAARRRSAGRVAPNRRRESKSWSVSSLARTAHSPR